MRTFTMSNHGVLCQTNVSLYLQFLNCASKNCLFLVLFSLSVSPSASFCTQQSQSNLLLFFHTIFNIKNASSQGSASHNNTVLSWRAQHWMLKLPQVASLVFQLSALQFSRKKGEKSRRTHRLQQHFKGRASLYATSCHGKKKTPKPPK